MAKNDWFARQANSAAEDIRSLPAWLKGDRDHRVETPGKETKESPRTLPANSGDKKDENEGH
jgi:hypothetical protein